MLNVKKRDGNIVPFDLKKIEGAIEKAFKGLNKNYSQDIIELLALKVTADFNNKVKDGVVDVRDCEVFT